MITKYSMIQKIKLLESWNGKLFHELNISKIMEISKKKTKPWVFNSLKELVSKRLLISRKVGNLNLYKLNLDNPLLTKTLQYLEAQDLLMFEHLDLIIETINKIPTNSYCLAIFGSFAKFEQTKNSDLDICFLTENEKVEGIIKPFFNDIKLNYAINIDEHYITFKDFIKMLLNQEENLGKQIFFNHKLFHNPDIYYQLIKEAYKNGFRP